MLETVKIKLRHFAHYVFRLTRYYRRDADSEAQIDNRLDF